jgi:hypothetical protein
MGFAIAAVAAGGALLSSQASQNAASTQADAANNASNQQMNMYNLSRQDVQPWLESGRNALGQLNSQMPQLTRSFSAADFQNDPGYQFNLQEGQKAIERSAAARGMLNSTSTMKDLSKYSQGMASQDYQNAYNRFNTDQSNTFNRLASLAGVGQTAASQNASGANSTGAAIGQNIQAAGNASAAGTVGSANAIQNGINSGTNTWMSQQYMNRFNGAGTQYGSDPTAGWSPQQLTMPQVGG